MCEFQTIWPRWPQPKVGMFDVKCLNSIRFHHKNACSRKNDVTQVSTDMSKGEAPHLFAGPICWFQVKLHEATCNYMSDAHSQLFLDWPPRCLKEDSSARETERHPCMEVNYSTNAHTIKPLCFHCGGEKITGGHSENLGHNEKFPTALSICKKRSR